MGGFSFIHAIPLLLVIGLAVLVIMTLWQLHRYLRALAALKEGEVLQMRRRMLDNLSSNVSEKQS